MPEPSVPVPAGPPVPDADLLDYAGLTLTGPDDPARGRLAPGARANLVADEYRRRAEAVSGLVLPAHAARVRESAGSYDYRFDVAAPADVESDGTWHTVPVCTVEVALEPEFVCVPSVDEAVFGTVHVTNASAHALLAGPADVSVGGEFLMTVPLPTLAPGERQRVGVGVVESVQVARRSHARVHGGVARRDDAARAHRGGRRREPSRPRDRARSPRTRPGQRRQGRADRRARRRARVGAGHRAPGRAAGARRPGVAAADTRRDHPHAGRRLHRSGSRPARRSSAETGGRDDAARPGRGRGVRWRTGRAAGSTARRRGGRAAGSSASSGPRPASGGAPIGEVPAWLS
ncbi:hypothetical protein ACU686_20030 [Yinghuangia aomiensis]